MFNIFKSINSSKIIPNNTSISGIKDIIEKNNNSDTSDKYEQLIEESSEIVKRFCYIQDNNLLIEAINKLNEAVNLKRSKPDAYFFLSCIAYIMNDQALSVKYLKITASIDSNYPKLNDLRESILKTAEI